MPAMGLGPYAASKAGLEQLMNVLRVEVGYLGVDVGVSYFWFIETDMVQGAEREMAAFAAMRGAMPRPLTAEHPGEDAAHAIVDGVHARSRRVVAPEVAARPSHRCA